MIEESIREFLINRETKLNINKLIEFMESTGIKFRNCRLLGPTGLTTYDCIYLDIDKLKNVHVKRLYYIILHEIGHYKRIIKMGGKDAVISKLSLEDFSDFFDHIIEEEIAADRYSCFVYNLLNNEEYPREATQQLHLEYRRKQYIHSAQLIFGYVKNKEENYKVLLESFIEK